MAYWKFAGIFSCAYYIEGTKPSSFLQEGLTETEITHKFNCSRAEFVTKFLNFVHEEISGYVLIKNSRYR